MNMIDRRWNCHHWIFGVLLTVFVSGLYATVHAQGQDGQIQAAPRHTSSFELPGADEDLPGAGRSGDMATNLWKNRRQQFANRAESEKKLVSLATPSLKVGEMTFGETSET